MTLLEPLNARSLALSLLLGTHPPELPARALVAFGELFGVPSGTTRTALSRMVTNGDVTADGGRYALSGEQRSRQRAQDTGRRGPAATWDGRWRSIVAADDQRNVTDRRRFRTVMANHRFGELRPDIWMRPANLEPPAPDPTWICTTGDLDGVDPSVLAGRLWDLDALAATARSLLCRIEQLASSTGWADEAAIPGAFTFSATVLRFLRNEPLLPSALTPGGWPMDDLRTAYDDFEQATQRMVRQFLQSA